MEGLRTRKVNISVRQLVEFVLRSGDLDSRLMGSDRALEGTRGHQRVQKSYDKMDLPEVTLKYSVVLKDYEIEVKGRADGILFEAQSVIIDEIKTVTKPLENLGDLDNELHWGQAKCYGFIYGLQEGLEEITLQLTYYQIATEEIKRSRRVYSIKELETFFYGLIEEYLHWGETIYQWRERRDRSIAQLEFPFGAYRKGQRSLAIGVYKSIKESKRLFAKAPTGIGKTMSTLFPAIKAMGEGHTIKIFYLTAKTITRSVAEEAVDKLLSTGLRLKSVTITAKDKICFEKDSSCNPDECQYAKGHFDRVNKGLKDLFDNEDHYTRRVIEEYAMKYSLCPFEFSLEIALWVDCVICDYNYVFDPRVYLKRFFLEVKEPYTFLVDEAHNLVDRGREMFSAELYKQSFLEIKRLFKETGKAVSTQGNKVNTQLLKLKKRCDEHKVYIDQAPPDEIYSSLFKFVEVAEEWLLENEKKPGHDELLELYFSVVGFLRMSELFDERYVTLLEKTDQDFKVKLYCVDPSFLLREAVNRGKSAVFFSATLAPIEFYRYLLGGEEDDYVIGLSSPFEQENLCLMIANGVSTKYKDRSKSYHTVVDLINQVIESKTGNYFVFFPSYQYMDEAYNQFKAFYPHVNIIKQTPQMTEEEREEFLAYFTSCHQEKIVGFAVLGGIFSEGIDLPGENLIGTIVIGVGLPQICTEIDVIRDYFQKKNGKGYEYAYQYPGMNKVLQAAGRVIRTENDRGVVLLVDSRYTSQSYLKIFPKEWNNYRIIRNDKDIPRVLKGFWHE